MECRRARLLNFKFHFHFTYKLIKIINVFSTLGLNFNYFNIQCKLMLDSQDTLLKVFKLLSLLPQTVTPRSYLLEFIVHSLLICPTIHSAHYTNDIYGMPTLSQATRQIWTLPEVPAIASFLETKNSLKTGLLFCSEYIQFYLQKIT